MMEDGHSVIQQQVSAALAEDIGAGDLTALLLPKHSTATAKIISRQEAVICGASWVNEVFAQLDKRVEITWHCKDGNEVEPNDVLCTLSGPARALMTGERCALNFLQTLSATATETRRYVRAISGTGVKILDTRKTLPGWRQAQKYAVRCGGGSNHRMGLYDAILIKENHIVASGGLLMALNQARKLFPDKPLEIEVETLAQLEEVLELGVNHVLLDNFSHSMLQEGVALAREREAQGYSPVTLEVSGNVTLETISEIAQTGIDHISVGALTKNIRAIDLSMLIDMS